MRKIIRNFVLSYVLNFIQATDDYEIDKIMGAVKQRYKVAHPDWEILYFALPIYNKEERKRLVQTALDNFSLLYL